MKKRILVLEDVEAVRRMNVSLLEAAGFSVDAGEDGEFGWQAVCAQPYDLLVTDGQMPKLGGLELLMRMREAGMKTPVILVTGTSYLGEPDDLKLAGLAAVLRKPYHLYELLPAVRRVLEGAQRVLKEGDESDLDWKETVVL